MSGLRSLFQGQRTTMSLLRKRSPAAVSARRRACVFSISFAILVSAFFILLLSNFFWTETTRPRMKRKDLLMIHRAKSSAMDIPTFSQSQALRSRRRRKDAATGSSITTVVNTSSQLNFTAMIEWNAAVNADAVRAANEAVKAATNRPPGPNDAQIAASPFFDRVLILPKKNVSAARPVPQWNLWNRLDVLSPPSRDGHQHDHNCTWAAFRAIVKTAGSPPEQMCIYNQEEDIFVSASIIRQGHWADCRELVAMFQEWHRLNPDYQEDQLVYLDVGGNIGSCVIEMLHSTEAKIVVLEPHPLNLQKMSSTLIAQPMAMRKRVALLPIGAGNESSQSTIYMSSNNRGNSVVGKVIKSHSSEEFHQEGVPIHVEALDNLFDKHNNYTIALMKLDVQGYECMVLDGMSKHLISHVQMIETEADHDFLIRQGCSLDGLKERLQQANFSVAQNGNEMVAKRAYTMEPQTGDQSADGRLSDAELHTAFLRAKQKLATQSGARGRNQTERQ